MSLRAAVIGLGMMGRNHVRVLRDLEGIDLVGVADVNGNPYKSAGDVQVFGSADELVEQNPDICVVAAPTDQHESLALLLAEAGVHALVEKPLADDTAAAERICQAFRDAGLIGCVGHIERYNPALLELRRRLDADELGEIFQIATRRQGPFPNRIRDVGVIKDLATHDIDLTAWVAGEAYSAISARATHKTGREHEDLVAATGMLADGTITNHLVNWLTPTKERVTWVTGERGCFLADTLTADLTFYANADVPTEWEAISQFRGVSEGDMTRFAISKPEPLAVELATFRDAVLGQDAEVVTMAEGRDVVEIAEAMVTSAREGRTIDLDWTERA